MINGTCPTDALFPDNNNVSDPAITSMLILATTLEYLFSDVVVAGLMMVFW